MYIWLLFRCGPSVLLNHVFVWIFEDLVLAELLFLSLTLSSFVMFSTGNCDCTHYRMWLAECTLNWSYALYMYVQCQNCPVNLRLLLSSLLVDKNNYKQPMCGLSQIFFKYFFLNLSWLFAFQEKRAQRKEKNDEIDSVKLKASVQGENSGYKPRGARETLNKFEGKENTKDTTTKPVTVSKTTF